MATKASRWKDRRGAINMSATLTAVDVTRLELTEAERANVDRGFAKDAPVSAWLLSFSIMFRVLERMADKKV